ncbi:helix-turn-helix domain-containing protein [Allokutzneria albata]|uniref:helix-turn-helix domain-containing protein n=1 Tax=Allokutzneria albata TaxID=211114 RepID=UPI0012DBE5B2|nr:hypothetical protein [Allokutzneria albata]
MADDLAKRFHEGERVIQDLAARVDRRPATVRRLLREAGITNDASVCLYDSDDDVAHCLAAHVAQGRTISELMRRTGLGERTIRRLLGGLDDADKRPNPAQVAKMVTEYRAGLGIRALSMKTGYTYYAIRTALLDADVSLRNPGGNWRDRS